MREAKLIKKRTCYTCKKVFKATAFEIKEHGLECARHVYFAEKANKLIKEMESLKKK